MPSSSLKLQLSWFQPFVYVLTQDPFHVSQSLLCIQQTASSFPGVLQRVELPTQQFSISTELPLEPPLMHLSVLKLHYWHCSTVSQFLSHRHYLLQFT